MIFAHIAGLPNNLKNNLFNKFKSSNYLFQDLELFTEKIINDKNMKALIQRYEYYCDKSKTQNITKLQVKQFIKKSKDIERSMNIYWKNKMNYYILELINNTEPKKKIILIGYCNFFKNIQMFINIQTNIKIFISLNSNEYVKDIIKYNLNKYYDDIINGNFNLDLLNSSFLSKKREIISTIYVKNLYDLKTFDQIINFLSISLETYDIPSILFYASNIDYNNKINLKKIIVYSDDWISLIASINDKNIIKGFENNDNSKPFIQELQPNIFNKLSDSVFLYIISNTSLFVPIYTKNYIYKYETNKPVQIYKKILIENISNKLKENKIKFIYYKKK